MGVFTRYENVAAKVSELQDLFMEPIIVVNEVVEHKVFFKILLGHFIRKEDALLFKDKLMQDHQMDAIGEIDAFLFHCAQLPSSMRSI